MLEAENDTSFSKSIRKSINLISTQKNKSIPLIFYSSGDYINYYTVALCFKIPCSNENFEIDYSSLDKLEIV
jgi:hypothetical protein